MQYQVTGNEYVSLPTIRQTDGAIEGVTFLYMQAKGMLELRGKDGLIKPYVSIDGRRMSQTPQWHREHCWIPSMRRHSPVAAFECAYLTPMGERGFGIRMTAENASSRTVRVTIGMDGDWDSTLHEVNESTAIDAGREVRTSGWNHMFVWLQKPGLPLFAFAPITSDNQPFSQIDQGAVWSCEGYSYDIHRSKDLAPGERLSLDVFFGIGYEEVAAATSAKEMLRRGYDKLHDLSRQWLAAREKHLPDDHIQTLLNTNLFFAFFYASGRTIDTEELCMMTSRSPRYYVSAAYWDRDSLLWAFPAILSADREYARELLLAVYQKQGRNFGVHSRFIDGTVLEPGFELDELCAPVIALHRYVQATGDKAFVRLPQILSRLEQIIIKLETHKHPDVALYDTFLQPTDDLHRYPYLAYDNVLVWKIFMSLAVLLDQPALAQQADRVREAVYSNFVVEITGKKVFAWSIDLEGHWDIYDEPPGSLQLLPFYGFCALEDKIWKATVALIRGVEYEFSFSGHAIAEIGCKHAPHPWVLSICNSLLSGHQKEAVKHLKHAKLDNGVACESVHEDTGECTTGFAFATCAGFLSYALLEGMR